MLKHQADLRKQHVTNQSLHPAQEHSIPGSAATPNSFRDFHQSPPSTPNSSYEFGHRQPTQVEILASSLGSFALIYVCVCMFNLLFAHGVV